MLTDHKQIGALKRAVEACGSLDSLGLSPKQYTAFIQAVAWFMGGPVGSVDAFVSHVTVHDVSSAKHSVLWLRGDSISLLTVGKAERESDPPELRGWTRPISSIRQLEIRSVDFYWPSDTDILEEVRPTVRIHFRDDLGVIAEIKVAERPTEFAREQAVTFIRRIQQALAGQAGSVPTDS